MNIFIIAKSIDINKGSEYRLAYLNLINILKNNNRNFNIFLLTPEYDNNVNNLTLKFSKYKNFEIIKVNYITYGCLLHNPLSRRVIFKIWHFNVLFFLFKNYSKIDVVHLLNTINYNSFGFYFLLKKRFIWGPIDGGTFVELKSYSNFNFFNKLGFTLLNILNQINFYLNPFFRLNLLCSDIIFSSTLNFKKKLSHLVNSEKILHLPDTGSDCLKLSIDEKFRVLSKEKIIYTWIGQDIPRKNLQYLIDIFNKLDNHERFILNIVGVKNDNLKKMDGLIFHGIVSFEIIEEILKKSHFLISTSIRDSNTSSAFEAFDMLVPTICPNQIGFADLVSMYEIGIKYDLNKSDHLLQIINKINSLNEIEFMILYKGFLKNIINVSDILSYENKSRIILDFYAK